MTRDCNFNFFLLNETNFFEGKNSRLHDERGIKNILIR